MHTCICTLYPPRCSPSEFSLLFMLHLTKVLLSNCDTVLFYALFQDILDSLILIITSGLEQCLFKSMKHFPDVSFKPPPSSLSGFKKRLQNVMSSEFYIACLKCKELIEIQGRVVLVGCLYGKQRQRNAWLRNKRI